MQPVLNLSACLLVSICIFSGTARGQMITGVWKGKIDKKKVEVKIVQKGDSLTGSSYYYESPTSYSRYAIKGYYDQQTNSAVWWDDIVIREGAGKKPLLSVADFNCPGSNEMYLDGKAYPKTDTEHSKGDVNLTKVTGTEFPDEWDYVIENYTVGTNDPDIIDGVDWMVRTPVPQPPPAAQETQPQPEPTMAIRTPVIQKQSPLIKPADPVVLPEPETVEQKFISRQKIVATEIPLEGDSIELRFYDNAQVDGDSISLFLNNKLLFTHVRLTDKPYTIKLPVNEMEDTNELTMVAENLGSIPPNTSYMVAILGDKRYNAQLASTENSSAMIRLKKQ